MSTETRPWRYDDEARRLGESLVEIKLAEPKRPEPDVGALDRIASGQMPLASIPADRAAAIAGVPRDMQKEEVRERLRGLLSHRQAKVASFIVGAARLKLATSDTGYITPAEMTAGGTGPAPGGGSTATKHEGAHQGPAANLIASGLKAINKR
jgi:hypothetical protein